MGRLTLWIGVVAVSACGRWNFDERPLGVDAPHCAAITGAAVSSPLTCGQPTRFHVEAICVDGMAAVGTPTGLVLVTADSLGELSAWAYDAIAGTASAQNVTLDGSASATLGAVLSGTEILVGTYAGDGTTKLYPLNMDLSSRGASVVQPGVLGVAPLATDGPGVGIAMLASNNGAGEIRGLTSSGAETIPVKQIAAPADSPSYFSLSPAGPGYVASWVAATPSPNATVIVLLDQTFAVVAGPVTTGTTDFDVADPRIAWAPASNTYLAVWFAKNVADNDDIWIQRFDATLVPLAAPVILAAGTTPIAATDGIDFWVTWRSQTVSGLDSARITPTGTVTPNPVMNSGGSPRRWTMIDGAGQAMLLWTETGGTDPDLWIQEMCH